MKVTRNIYEFLLGIIIFLQVVMPKMAPLGIILFTLYVIFEAFRKKLSFSFTRIHFVLILFYFAYLFGVVFTEIPREASHVLESKLSFVIFPLLFMFLPQRKLKLSIPFWLIIFGLLFRFASDFSNSWMVYSQNNSLSDFTSSAFSIVHHPTYMSIYYLIGVFVVLYSKRWMKNPLSIWFKIPLIGVFLLGYFLCLSLSALIFLMLLIGVYGFLKFRQRFGWIVSLGLVVVLIFGFLEVVRESRSTIEDVEYTFSAMEKYVQSPDAFVKKSNRWLTGNEVRLVLWTVSAKAIRQQPFGHGTGNTDLVIGYQLRSYGDYQLARHNYNSHNQYLQTGIELGVFGILILIGMFVIIFRYAQKRKDVVLMVLTTAFAFNSLFESMFQRESGIVFFCFFVFFLYLTEINMRQQDEKSLPE